MKDRILGISLRALAFLSGFAIWHGTARLLAPWLMRNDFINQPVDLKRSCGFVDGYNICENHGYAYGRSWSVNSFDLDIPPHQSFWHVYTDGWGWLGAHFAAFIALFICFVIFCAGAWVVDKILHGFKSKPSDPCDIGECGCNCKCCRRRKKRYEDAQEASRNAALIATVAAATSIAASG